ncbi:hypothetical protein DPMN_142049 [Dreissena polymorpha]|uniref:Gamma tubulin complex component protein N-terminal domain-containing protein n=1 Tax=Dreissena polymorpha TaxID=45954 RepID=A0A9D4JLU7_DREPO|nr:hypothetical protein DPMN_142049 [Dreissena polymorpha]
MSKSKDQGGGAAPALLKKLCCKITGLPETDVQPYLQFAYKLLGSHAGIPVEADEFQVSEKIRRKLIRRGREKDAVTFAELHRKLQSQGLVKNRWAILHLLFLLSENTRDKSSSSLFGRGLPKFATSTPFNAGSGLRRPFTAPPSTDTARTPSQQSIDTTASSGISSIHGDIRSNEPTPVPQSFLPSTTYVSLDGERSHRHGPVSRVVGAVSRHDPGSDSAVVPRSSRQTIKVQSDNTSFEIPETELVRDLVYVFQGIEGKWVRFDASKDGYKVDPQAGIPKAIRQLVSKLAECGWLFNKVKNYVETRCADKTFGLVGQSFCAALQQELTEYYRLIAVLESQLQEELDQGIDMVSQGSVTLRRLVVWTFDPLIRLKTLAALVDVCKGKKGGALASSIYSYMQHGDPFVKSLIRHILTMVSQPIYATLLRWIYDGELQDTHDEFFVAADPTVKNDRLWHDKYTLRKSMIPAFITTDQARRILLTGKSINFLRQVCQDRTPTKGREVAMAIDMSQGTTTFFDI